MKPHPQCDFMPVCTVVCVATLRAGCSVPYFFIQECSSGEIHFEVRLFSVNAKILIQQTSKSTLVFWVNIGGIEACWSICWPQACVCVCVCMHEILNICKWCIPQYKNRTCACSVWYLINMAWMHHFFIGVRSSVLLPFAKWSNHGSLIGKMNNLDKLEIKSRNIKQGRLDCCKTKRFLFLTLHKPVWLILLITFTREVKCNEQKSGVWWCLRGCYVLILIWNDHHLKFSSVFRFYDIFVYLFSRWIA